MAATTPVLPQTEVTIGDKRYQLTALHSLAGRKALVRLNKVIGPVLSEMLKGQASVTGDDPGAAERREALGLAGALGEFSDRLSEDDFEYFWGLFSKCTEMWGGEGFVSLESRGTYGAFACDYGAMVQLMRAHIQFNFSSFLSDLGSMIPRI